MIDLKKGAYSEGLPSFLVQDGGINSGFMIAHCTVLNLNFLLFFY